MLESYDDNSDIKSTLKSDELVISIINDCPIEAESVDELGNILVSMPISLSITIGQAKFTFANYEE